MLLNKYNIKSNKYLRLVLIIILVLFSFNVFAVYSSSEVEKIPENTIRLYENYMDTGVAIAGKYDLRFSDIFIKYSKNGYFGIDGYEAPSGEEDKIFDTYGERTLGYNLNQNEDKIYTVKTILDYDAIDYWYEKDEFIMNDYDQYRREEFKEKLEALEIEDSEIKSSGYGRYGLTPGKNLMSFITFAYNFYLIVHKDHL